MGALVGRRSRASRVAPASARAASATRSAGPARVKTDRLWSGSLCRSRRAVPAAEDSRLRTARSRPSLTLTTHSRSTAPAWHARGSPGDAGRADRTGSVPTWRRPQWERRRRRRMRRRSRSDAPPHTPWSMWCSRAYSRQASETGHSAQMRLGDEHAHAVVREKHVGRNFLALAPGHPIGRHRSAPFPRMILREHPVQSQVFAIGSS